MWHTVVPGFVFVVAVFVVVVFFQWNFILLFPYMSFQVTYCCSFAFFSVNETLNCVPVFSVNGTY